MSEGKMKQMQMQMQVQLPPKSPGSSSSSNGGFMTMTEQQKQHRRCASDSVAMLDNSEDEYDAEQFMSMLADIEPFQVPSDSPSSTSTSIVVQVQHTKSMDTELHQTHMDPNPPMDPKRLKRILANRQSAQRSRVRKLNHISELERSVTALQTQVSALSPQVAFLDHQRVLLNVDNSALKQRIAALAQDKLFKDAHCEALKKEVQRLRKVYEEQQRHIHKSEQEHNNNNNNNNEAHESDEKKAAAVDGGVTCTTEAEAASDGILQQRGPSNGHMVKGIMAMGCLDNRTAGPISSSCDYLVHNP